MTIKRIIFTGDILRPFLENNKWVSATSKNIKWLKHLIGWQLSKATLLPQSSVIWETNGFDARKIYDLFGLSINYESWASIFYSKIIPSEIEEKLIEPFKNSCVIGVEIPDILQYVLSKNQIPFIDIIAHPVRFLDDLIFGFRTNHQDIHHKIAQFEINMDDHCIPRANLLRAKVTWMKKLSLPPGTALITGQVATDKALICRQSGRFLNMGDYLDQIQEVFCNHPKVLFKPHPYQDEHCPSRKIIKSMQNIQEVYHNFYYLISQEEITDIYSITSGTVGEAPFFDKTGNLFGEPLYFFGSNPPSGLDTSDGIPVGAAFLESSFWATILEPVMSVQKNLDHYESLLRPSLLRRSLNADWDYSYIDSIVQHEV